MVRAAVLLVAMGVAGAQAAENKPFATEVVKVHRCLHRAPRATPPHAGVRAVHHAQKKAEKAVEKETN